jgi:hypothetical protein
MVEIINTIIGVGIVILNIIPFIIKKPKYLFLTILVSLIMLFLLSLF